jgi:hypothetical protein
VANVGHALLFVMGKGRKEFPPLDVTPAPCLDVIPSCHIKGWLPREVEERLRRRSHASAHGQVRPRGCPHDLKIQQNKAKQRPHKSFHL